MPEKTDLNISPYYDDYSEDKKYSKILYRAGRPLQARELTQSQSILQGQIERFGSHIFEEGSLVTGAESDVDMDVFYVKVKSANPNASGQTSVESYRTSFHGKYLQGKSSGVVAKVTNSTAETTDDPVTLFLHFHSQGTDVYNSPVFYQNEVLQEVSISEDGTINVVSGNNNEFTIKATTDDPIGRASLASISEGIVFIRGFFCLVDKQQIVLEKYSAAPSYRIGLNVTETIIDSATDTTLLDNSQGTSNENAAGADRLKMELVLSKFKLDTTDDADFIELARVNGGIIENKISRPQYGQIEQTLARRTFDANGDFVVNQFTHSLREHLNNTTNNGFYTEQYGGDADRFVMQISPGKAYVKGFEIDKIGTTSLNFAKARSTVTLAGSNTPVRLGNILRVTNAHGLPEFGNEGTNASQERYGDMDLYDTVQNSTNVNAGSPSFAGKHIGKARIRNVDLHSGASDSSGEYNQTTSIWNIYLFDIKMYTEVKANTFTGTFTEGDQIVSTNSAGQIVGTGIVAYNTSNTTVYIHDVTGGFYTGDTISTKGKTSATGTITETRTYNVDRTRGVTQASKDTTLQTFVGDAVADADNTLSGSISLTAQGALSGFGSRFASELKEGDIIIDGTGNQRVIQTVTDSSNAQCTDNSGVSPISNGNVTRRRVRIHKQDQTAAIYAWPRDWVAEHTGKNVKLRRQHIVTINSGAFTISAGSQATFEARNTDNFSIAVVKASSDSNAFDAGDLLNIENLSPNVTGNQLTCTLANNSGAVLKVTSTVLLTSPSSRSKTLNKSRLLKVTQPRSANGYYGTAYDDKEITLGVADVHKIHAIYEGGTAPVMPNASFGTVTGTFTQYETLVGQTSNARAILVYYAGSGAISHYRMVSGSFVENEVIVGASSSASVTISNVHQGSEDIKSRYFFDNGQRDGYYDLGKLTRKTGEPAPNGPLLICFDYFSAAAGEYFDVESYKSIDYDDIPVYSPNRIDLGGLEPDGTFELSDCIDFRPVAGQILGTSNFKIDNSKTPTNAIDLSDNTTGAVFAPFGYDTGRNFGDSRAGITQTHAITNDSPVPGSSVTGDIKFYVGRTDKVYLHKSGTFQTAVGIPSLSPTKPKGIDDAIELFELQVPAYTSSIKNVKVRSHDHRRFTMKDIGKINNRVTNLERITSLSLLEKDTQTKQILDADGFDRFKSGFLVDNFKGHRVGDVNHPDYNVAIDTELGAMRPKNFSQFFDISLNTALSSDYQKTGDLITLPYTTTNLAQNDKASRHINVNPYHVFSFFGNVKLTPETDIWQDRDQLPEVRINREGNFDALVSENKNAMGTVWNEWQTTWAGKPETVATEVQATSNGSWNGDPTQHGTWTAGIQVTREITETVETQTRTGVTTSVVEDFVETRNDRVVSVTLIPFMRARTIAIHCTNLKPNTFHYFFFDNERIDDFIAPTSSAYSHNGGTTVLSISKTDKNGELKANFFLPGGKFPTGQRELRVTSSYSNISSPNSHGSGMYQAQGHLTSTQTEVTSTRNGRVIRERTSGERQITKPGERTNILPWDTVAPPVPIPEIPPIREVYIELPPQILIEEVIIERIVEIEIPVISVVQSPPVFIPIPNDTTPSPVLVPPVPVIPPEPVVMTPVDTWQDFTGRTTQPQFAELERGWGDPLAQSFLVEQSGGTFATGIDVFFQSKDTHIPVSVEIRNMVNGYPGQIVMPFSVVTLNPSAVSTSQDGSKATTFTFESPVYLQQDVEYCFVVYSNSNEYEAFISRMGEKDIATGQTIAGQPYAGSLFLSQNASTWTATQEDDLKFTIKRAVFNQSKTPKLVFENDALPTTKLQSNPIETYIGKNYVKVYNYSHGMYKADSNVILSGITGNALNGVLRIATPSVSGTPSAGTYTVQQTSTTGSGTGCSVEIVVVNNNITSSKITNPGEGHAVGNTLTFTDFDGGTADCTIVIDKVGDTLGGFPIEELNRTLGYSTISNIEIDAFTIVPDLSSYDLKSSYGALESTVGGGSNSFATRNYYYDSIHTMIPNVIPPLTRVLAAVTRTPMDSPEGYNLGGNAYDKNSTQDFITLNDNAYFGTSSVVASPINEQNEMASTKSFTCTLQLQSATPNISPVIDVGTVGAIAILNRINNIDTSADVPGEPGSPVTNYIPSTDPDGDNNAMVYITRKVNLKTPATSLRVVADVFKPETTGVEVLYKVLKNDDSTPFDDLGWSYFNGDGSPNTAVESDARNFKENEWSVEDLPEFSAFSVKIVGKATNTSVIPMVSALRCLGLA